MSGQPDTTVHLVDDDPAVRDAIGVLLDSVGLGVRSYPDAPSFLADIDPERAGCVITDVCMPGMDGLALQDTLLARDLPWPLIVISGHGDIALAVEMVRKGALDFFEKPFRNHLVLERVREAIALDAARRAQRRQQRHWRERLARLTAREREILQLLMAGASNKRVALRLDLSPRTVETHRASILRKTDTKSITELAVAMAGSDLR